MCYMLSRFPTNSFAGLKLVSRVQITLSMLMGALRGYIIAAKGLMQGCALPPYLFVMATEALSHLLDDAAMRGELEFHLACRRVGLTHLGFADDLVIFHKGTSRSLQAVLNVFLSLLCDVQVEIEPSKD